LDGETNAGGLQQGALKKAWLFYFVCVMFSHTTGDAFDRLAGSR